MHMWKVITEAMDVSKMGTAALYAAVKASEESDSDEDEDASLGNQ